MLNVVDMGKIIVEYCRCSSGMACIGQGQGQGQGWIKGRKMKLHFRINSTHKIAAHSGFRL